MQITPIAHRAAATLIVKTPGERFPKMQTVAQLLILAEMRQAHVSTETFNGYWKVLHEDSDFTHCEMQDLVAAVRAIYMVRRAEGETAFPEFARIAEEVKKVSHRRLRDAEDEVRRVEREASLARRKEELAAWEALTPEERETIEREREEDFKKRFSRRHLHGHKM